MLPIPYPATPQYRLECMSSANSIANVEKVVIPPQNPTPNNKTHTPGLGFTGNKVTTTPNKNAPKTLTNPVATIDAIPGKYSPNNLPTP